MASSTLHSSAFICRSCSRQLRPCLPSSTSRTFSTTPSAGMPSSSSPYSPNYIDIPHPPQRYAPYKPRAKGIRPVPRKIFPNAASAKKVTPEYLALVSKEPINHSRPGENAPATEKAYISWRERMAESRRRNIRDGLLQLHAEKLHNDSIIAARSAKKQEIRRKLLAEEDPEIVKLTTPTILSALRQKQPLTDPDREERLARKRENYIRAEEKKLLARRENLHELYIRAHEFTLTEAQLDALINAKFNDLAMAESINEIPPDSRGIVSEERREVRGPNDWAFGDERITKTFVEALTGGSTRYQPTLEEKIDRDDALMSELDVLAPKGMQHGLAGYRGRRRDSQVTPATDLFSVLIGNTPKRE
ncbi:hypothetical protein TWF694_010312 [Orbilia ellipsospora]|uniref:Uncharacterized protein n=1 Tax=Orbilia ellipsospora TaxID=2528407 RepID=A0AAV9X9X9_9PEZI